ncbi:NHL repeat-containing protein 3 [Bufo bufo]|uniref:NHL repeat-containing protein 3 n=1 Tax=Bufo bufo TaxID=8384 RepID=UPI001ABE3281|nr:NHL repeat-containing protein 3 [Bufo bufo]XP_040282024.1 NHL repeat-containing protein 3 [Bufo bufo]
MKFKSNVCLSAALVSLALCVLLWRDGRYKARAKSVFNFLRPASRQLYKLDAGWPRSPGGITGVPYDVAVDHLNSLVYVAQRGDNVSKVLVFTEDGYFKTAWKTHTLEMPHGIFAVTDEKNVKSIWITDVGQGPYGHTVKQYSPSGVLLKTLGTPGIAGSRLSPLQFDQPADIFIKEEDEIYIVDGDGGMNNRLLKLTDDFSLQWTLGGNGTKPSQFYIPHSVAMDDVGRIWVADRGNKRIQVFDAMTAEWIGTWDSCFTEDGPYSVRFTSDKKYVVVAQLNISRLLFLAVPPVGAIGDCNVVNTIQMADGVRPHLVDVNVETGSIYVAELGAEQVQKYVPL